MAIVLGVNTYASAEEADLYFENRVDVAAWESASVALKEQSLMTATRYLDQLSFAGYTTEETQYLAWPRVGGVTLPSRGRDIQFDQDYEFTDLADEYDFDIALAQLPFEIRAIKTATIEQAYHIVNNDGLFDYQGQTPDSISVGSITLNGLGAPGSAPKRPKIVTDILKPVLATGTSYNTATWYRAN